MDSKSHQWAGPWAGTTRKVVPDDAHDLPQLSTAMAAAPSMARWVAAAAWVLACCADPGATLGESDTLGEIPTPATEPEDSGEEEEEEVEIFNPFTAVSVGLLCEEGAWTARIVLSTQSECEVHASELMSPDEATVAIARLPIDLQGVQSLTVTSLVCLEPGACEEEIPLTLELESFKIGEGATGSWSIEHETGQLAGVLEPNWCEYEDFLSGSKDKPVSDLAVSEVALYQSVKIPIGNSSGVIAERNAGVVARRPALLRVFVEPKDAWIPREVMARVHLEASADTVTMLEQEQWVSVGSSEDDFATSFQFDVPADVMVEDLKWAVSLHETEACLGIEGDTEGTRIPATDLAPMDAQDAGEQFNVVLVPVRYDADGSGRLPDVSQSQLDRYYELMYAMFPVAELNLTVREAMPWSQRVYADGSGWPRLANKILSLRQDDGAAGDVYYYGVFAPASSLDNYCDHGCVLGLATDLPGPDDDYPKGSIGLGYTGQTAAETFVHEMGHSLGRPHAPCGNVAGPDRDFPYSDGHIGVWGYHMLTQTLLSPSRHADMMSYCSPPWISDFNYNKLFNRIAYVSNGIRKKLARGAAGEWSVVFSDASGLSLGAPITLNSEPKGTPRSVSLLDAERSSVDVVTAYEYRYTHIEGSTLLLPKPGPGVVALDLGELGVVQLD